MIPRQTMKTQPLIFLYNHLPRQFLLQLLGFLLYFPLLGQQVILSNEQPSGGIFSPTLYSQDVPVGYSYPSDISPAYSSQTGWDIGDLLEEPEFFEEKSFSLSIGIGLRTNVNLTDRVAEIDQIDAKGQIPGISLILERQVWENLGVGISLGYQSWKFSPLKYTYHYVTGGVRAAYHINLDFIENLDLYLGGGASYRMILLTNSERDISESAITPHLLFGSRYYLTETLGVFIEISDDTNSWVKIGSTLYFE